MGRKPAEACKKKGGYGRMLTGAVGNTNVPPGCECLAPCQKTYLTGSSSGTIKYQKKLKRQAKFPGCQAVEDELLRKGLISYGLRESLTSTGHFHDEVLSEELGEAVRFASLGENRSKNNLAVEFPSSHANLVGQLNAEDLLIDLPATKKRRSSKKFINYLKSLTDRQFEAVTSYLVNNPNRRSQREIAKKLGISEDSLRDRLAGAMVKFQKHYPSGSCKAN